MSEQLEVNKITLGSGKVCLFKPMKIKHTELATMAVGKRGESNPMLVQNLMMQELCKMLLVKVGDKEPTQQEKEKLDDLFTLAEYAQIQRYLYSEMGDDEGAKKPQIEVVISGGK